MFKLFFNLYEKCYFIMNWMKYYVMYVDRCREGFEGSGMKL